MKHCLIVEDSKIVRKISRGMLEKFGFEVTEAEDGVIAQDKVAEAMPDMILLDWHMPNMNGIEFIRWLRGQAADGHVPVVIFCTSETGMDHIQEAIMEGANEYVMKPFDEEILRSKFEMLELL